jgi:hypothetical protein
MTFRADGTLQDGRALIGPVDAPGLHVMTYNIRRLFRRYRPGSPDRWADREPLIAELLQREQPALLGTQEAMPTQGRALSHALGRHYRRIGHGRNADGHGEGCPTFYDTRCRTRPRSPDPAAGATWCRGSPWSPTSPTSPPACRCGT